MRNQESTIRKYITDSLRAPLLSKEEEYELAVAWQDTRSEAARAKIIAAYQKMVIKESRMYNQHLEHSSLQQKDLIQEGNIGLMRAAETFNPHLGYRFLTYAQWYVRTSIRDYILKHMQPYELGNNHVNKVLLFSRGKFTYRHGPGLSQAEMNALIAKDMKTSVTNVERFETSIKPFFLDAPQADEDDSVDNYNYSFLQCDEETPEVKLDRKQAQSVRCSLIEDHMHLLSSRERMIVERRHRTEEKGQQVTLGELAAELGISKERVRQIECTAMAKLLKSMGRDQRAYDLGHRPPRQRA